MQLQSAPVHFLVLCAVDFSGPRPTTHHFEHTTVPTTTTATTSTSTHHALVAHTMPLPVPDDDPRSEDIGDSLLASELSNPALPLDKPAPPQAGTSTAASTSTVVGMHPSLYAMATAPAAGIGTPARAPSPIVSSTRTPPRTPDRPAAQKKRKEKSTPAA